MSGRISSGGLITSRIGILARSLVLHITNKRREVQTDFPILWARQSPSPRSEPTGSCKHATTRGTHPGLRCCLVHGSNPPPEPRSNLGYSISQLSWHQKVDLGVGVDLSSSHSSLSSKTRATCCCFSLLHQRANSQVALGVSGSKHHPGSY